ncbi:hypothetical protein [Nocardia gamkensis]|uniref:hypothetical protein n=1 Tax=Nocardia gamkensis TaxID=352869 RepID=UPI0037CC750A
MSGLVSRWVASVDSDIPRTEHGLVDSRTLARDWYNGDRPERAEDLVGTHRSYVLLAPGGAGKSTLIEDLKVREPDSRSVDLKLEGRQALINLVNSLSSSDVAPSGGPSGSVFIDAVDEALQTDPDIGYVLIRVLSRPEAKQLSWRLACRPASWTVDLADGLRTALSGFERLELLPLSVAGIGELAGSDTDGFLKAVAEARLTRLLAYPLSAGNLLRQWRESGELPASRSEAMGHAVADRLTETSITRQPGKVDDYRRRLVAERLAAISMFCGVSNFALRPATGPLPSSGQTITAASSQTPVLAVNAVPTQTEPALSGTLLTVDDVREVLDTALFTAGVPGTVIFVHQSYSEYLAAHYLMRRGVIGQRLVSLLGADVNGLVPGPMIEVLGWLLASGAPVPDTLLADNAKYLLSTTGVELVSDRIRRRLVEALLHGAASGTIDEGWQIDTSVLGHPELAAQLHEAAADVSNHWVAFWVCRIARQCVVRESADDLLEIAVGSTWPDPMRAEAVKAFAAVAPRERMAELVPLLELSSDEDPHDEILAAVLRAVLPDAVEFGLIRKAFRPRRTRNYIGGYHRLLGELAELVPNQGVVPALIHAVNHRPEWTDSAFDQLIGGLLHRAWVMRDSAIAAEIGAALGNGRLPRRHMLDTERLLPWQSDDDPDLRRVVAATALVTNEHAFVAVLDLNLLTPADIEWLIDWMTTAPPETLAPARVTLRSLLWSPPLRSADSLPATDEDHPAHAELERYRQHQEISSQQLPEQSSQPEVEVEVEEDPSPTAPELETVLRDAITRAGDDLGEWWNIVLALAGDWRTDPEVLTHWDLTSGPMWSILAIEEQQALLRLGMDYLAVRQPDVGRWVGRKQFSVDDAVPDWAGVFLLATLAEHHPNLLAEVEPATWTIWAPVLTVTFPYTGTTNWHRGIRDAAPQAGREAIDAALREQVQKADGFSFAHHPLADFADPSLIAVVEQVARDADGSAARRDEAFEVLVEHAPDTALDVAHSALDEDTALASALAVLARLAPDELVTTWNARGHLDPVEPMGDVDPARLSDESLITLTHMLLDEFPFAEDPPQTIDFTESTPQSAARRLRMSLLQTMAGRGMAPHLAALALDRPAPDLELIRHLLQEARIREALANWRSVQPGMLMGLLTSGDARLVRDSAGLLTVLLEQLDRIQHDIRERGTFRSLWDGDPGTAGAKPKGEDTISDWLAEQLSLRLQPHIVVDREIQVTRRKPKGVGTRIDLTATSGGAPVGRVAFEAKLVTNTSLLTAIDDQLVGQYMDPAPFTHGIYIIYWTATKFRRSKKHPDADALAEQLRTQARRHIPRRHVEVVVFDIGPKT